MVKRTGGPRTKTRHKLGKNVRQRGKLSIRSYLQQFTEGDKVLLKAEPAVQGGMYHPRYHGKVGVIVAARGDCYFVNIKDYNATKKLIVHPVHMRRLSR